MTHSNWITETDPLELLLAVDGFSQRKGKLFVVGCCMQHPVVMQNRLNRSAILAVEQFADANISTEVLRRSRGRGKIGYSIATACGTAVPGPLFIALTSYLSDDHKRNCDVQLAILRDIFSNPFRPVTIAPEWLTPTVVGLAEAIYADRAFDRLPILADAFEEAGCDNADVLAHCRSDGPHVRGCWVVDLVTGRA